MKEFLKEEKDSNEDEIILGSIGFVKYIGIPDNPQTIGIRKLDRVTIDVGLPGIILLSPYHPNASPHPEKYPT